MEFLVTMKPLNGTSVPPEEALQLTIATLDYWEQLMKSGKASGGSFVEGQRGGGIIKAESLEELYSILAGAPNSAIVDYEVHGLTSLENTKKKLKEKLAALKKM